MQRTEKKVYNTPKLTVHGAVEEITKQCFDKGAGAGDGLILQNIGPLSDACS